jgi:hypothetical protein
MYIYEFVLTFLIRLPFICLQFFPSKSLILYAAAGLVYISSATIVIMRLSIAEAEANEAIEPVYGR